jgi:hypothetical protein
MNFLKKKTSIEPCVVNGIWYKTSNLDGASVHLLMENWTKHENKTKNCNI